MEEKDTLFDYLEHVVFTYGIMMVLMLCFTVLVGEDAAEISSLFSLRDKGLPKEIMLQFLGISFFINGWRSIFMTEIIIKRMSVVVRIGLMLTMTVCTIVVFVLVFGWFPADMWEPWVLFILSFLLCFAASISIMTLKTRAENKKMEEGLNKIKERWQENENGK